MWMTQRCLDPCPFRQSADGVLRAAQPNAAFWHAPRSVRADITAWEDEVLIWMLRADVQPPGVFETEGTY